MANKTNMATHITGIGILDGNHIDLGSMTVPSMGSRALLHPCSFGLAESNMCASTLRSCDLYARFKVYCKDAYIAMCLALIIRYLALQSYQWRCYLCHSASLTPHSNGSMKNEIHRE